MSEKKTSFLPSSCTAPEILIIKTSKRNFGGFSVGESAKQIDSNQHVAWCNFQKYLRIQDPLKLINSNCII